MPRHIDTDAAAAPKGSGHKKLDKKLERVEGRKQKELANETTHNTYVMMLMEDDLLSDTDKGGKKLTVPLIKRRLNAFQYMNVYRKNRRIRFSVNGKDLKKEELLKFLHEIIAECKSLDMPGREYEQYKSQ